MKKIISLIVVAVLLATVAFAGCAQQAPAASEEFPSPRKLPSPQHRKNPRGAEASAGAADAALTSGSRSAKSRM